MSQLIYPALFGVSALLYSVPTAAFEEQQTQVQPLNSVIIQSRTKDWKQANQKVAELGGWQFYASETASHQSMNHSGHKKPVDHSQHKPPHQMDHSQHSEPQQTGDEHEHHH